MSNKWTVHRQVYDAFFAFKGLGAKYLAYYTLYRQDDITQVVVGNSTPPRVVTYTKSIHSLSQILPPSSKAPPFRLGSGDCVRNPFKSSVKIVIYLLPSVFHFGWVADHRKA